ncbi:HPr-rel-A system PqqD family peptide chaperone [Sphingomonas japonica]|uniref:PqqD family protein of HPr-rel-A system n=1 Tax=Sphingomonas japonica TaxID=511662 RepID=A0ABX0U0J3_9SPHN|nr:HPr-rel-A system PqqD family peptide chaperone [Sphingomonas japonica]NIJ22912.1 PqqD family protein of HPr-rel-A system [Sphingomonas japonica]
MIVYRSAAPATLRRSDLDAMAAIYHRASGQTHLVASPVPEILDCLAEPLSLDALLAALGERFDLVDADRGGLQARLDELAASGLVERC